MARVKGCVTRAEIISFGESNLKKMQKQGLLMNGVPSQATLCRIDQTMDDDGLAESMAEFVRKHVDEPKGLKVIAIDGKCTRGTVQEDGRNPDIVSGYSVDEKLTLATEMCDAKSNEIPTAGKLIDKLDLSGCVVTADAMFCQKQLMDSILKKGGHFLIEVKANQKTLRWDIEDKLEKATPLNSHKEEATLEHGRIESRECWTYDASEVGIDLQKWSNVLTVMDVVVTSEKKKDGTKTEERRIYITDLRREANVLNAISKKHWGIESYHWSLDTCQKQDGIKRKTAKAARNLDTIQRMCLSIISIWRRKRKKIKDRLKGYTEIVTKCSDNLNFLFDVMALK